MDLYFVSHHRTNHKEKHCKHITEKVPLKSVLEHKVRTEPIFLISLFLFIMNG
jgi:hypothetical protein